MKKPNVKDFGCPLAVVQVKRNGKWQDVFLVNKDRSIDQVNIFAKELGPVTEIKLKYLKETDHVF